MATLARPIRVACQRVRDFASRESSIALPAATLPSGVTIRTHPLKCRTLNSPEIQPSSYRMTSGPDSFVSDRTPSRDLAFWQIVQIRNAPCRITRTHPHWSGAEHLATSSTYYHPLADSFSLKGPEILDSSTVSHLAARCRPNPVLRLLTRPGAPGPPPCHSESPYPRTCD
jgi:hypothetical protein